MAGLGSRLLSIGGAPLLGLAILAATPAVAEAVPYADAWSSSHAAWSRRLALTLDNEFTGSATLTSFTVLVQLDDSRIDYTLTDDQGDDLRFVTPGGTELSYEIEAWDELGTSLVWVKVPSIPATASSYVYLYYGNGAASAGAAPGSAWDGDHEGAWHMSESGGDVLDSTSNALDLTDEGTAEVAGKVGQAIDFDGTAGYLASGEDLSAVLDGASTLSYWTRTATRGRALTGWFETLVPLSFSSWGFLDPVGGKAGVALDDTVALSTTAIDDDGWHHVALTRSASSDATLKVYVDGALEATETGAGTSETHAFGDFGRMVEDPDGTPGYTYYDGLIDELRLSSVARSSAWIDADFRSQSDTFIVWCGSPTDWYPDSDGDGAGDETSDPTSSCAQPNTPGVTAKPWVTNDDDCDDADSARPDTEIACNGIDDDCDGVTDPGVAKDWYPDVDGDGSGDETATPTNDVCPPSDTVDNADDCDDDDPDVPGELEIACNGIDDDCDGTTDPGVAKDWYPDADGDGKGDASATPTNDVCPPADTVDNDDDCDDTDPLLPKLWYRDQDGDTYGNPLVTQSDCTAPTGYVANSTDCDDSDADEKPGQKWYADTDGDTYGDPLVETVACLRPVGSVLNKTDCDDDDADINPGEDEVCDGVDQDCDGAIDDGVLTTWLPDADNDLYPASSPAQQACTKPAGHILPRGDGKTDCKDSDNTVNPGKSEVCNGVDDNCAGGADEGLTFVDYFRDQDDDKYPKQTDTKNTCSGAPSGYIAQRVDAKWDCDDTDPALHPATKWYEDGDGDTFGNPLVSLTQCEEPSGYVLDKNDCDDSKAAVKPTAKEVCNDVDDDCNGSKDDTLTFVDYYRDQDDDKYPKQSDTKKTCDGAPVGYIPKRVDSKWDCNDGAKDINPGAAEICNKIDDDCDGKIDIADDSFDPSKIGTYYEDKDGDTYGNASVSKKSCEPVSGYVASENTDCDDGNKAVNPGATEVCNSIDDDCDAKIDDADPSVDVNVGGTVYYKDADADGYGNASDSLKKCAKPTGYVTDKTDCDDKTKTTYPGATETCGDGVDSNCDNKGGPNYDEDGDGANYTQETAAGAKECNDDSDADGVPDKIEWTKGDTDNDGKKNVADTDDDGDGILTKNEAYAPVTDPTKQDTDKDGVPDYLDTDDDGDTVLTKLETGKDTDKDGIPNNLDTDDDGDGALTKDELAWSLDPLDPDMDDDEVLDGDEWGSSAEPRDTDGDGDYDVIDEDDDGDGLPTIDEGTSDVDGIPQGDTKPCLPTKPDGSFGDGKGNHIDTDSDGDGKPDATEGFFDEDEDGIPNFLDCNDKDGCEGDNDLDGLENCDEDKNKNQKLDPGETSPTLADTDGDGVKDPVEVGPDVSKPIDTDGDKIIDAQDTDDDGDGVPTAAEAYGTNKDPTKQDSDGDGIKDYLDTDDDGDGKTTKAEDIDGNGDPRNDDSDQDGKPDYLDANDNDGPGGDLDGDGLSNGLEQALGSDPNDRDSDGDGIPDDVEIGDPAAAQDSDGDGVKDIVDADDDGDDIGSDVEGDLDLDGDGVPNWKDDDSDGDGKPDKDEGTGDDDCDGAPNFLDADDADGTCAPGEEPPVATIAFDDELVCGCASNGAPTGAWAALGLALLAVRRRR